MEKQIRYSRQREQILDYLRGVESHPDADTIYSALKEKDSSVSIATVYRNLAFLSERGEINKIDAGNSKTNYDGNISDHQHFVCTACGKIQDIIKKAEAPNDFELGKVSRVSLIYYGTCKDCMAKTH
ncbi:MAG: transcriptional repressor [Bacillota bacterium]